MKESGGACSGIGDAFLTGFLADSAAAEGFGDDHTPPGAQDGPFHGTREDVLHSLIQAMNPPSVERSLA